MKTKLFAVALILAIVVIIPLSAQETPTTAPLLFTNTPTRFIGEGVEPTPAPVTGAEVVTVVMPERVTFEGQKFQIVEFEFEKTANTLQSISITVQNISDLPASGRVWYLLAPPGVTEDPWTQAIFTAEEQSITDLTAQETRTFTFDAPSSEVVGEFSISAWVHQTESDGSSLHADGVGYEPTIVLASSVYLSVEYVDYLPTETGETLVFVTMNLQNFSDEMTEVGYSYTLAKPDDPTPWETGAFTLPFQSVMLMPGQSLHVTTRNVVTLADENLQVIGWLQERVGDEMQFRNNDPYP